MREWRDDEKASDTDLEIFPDQHYSDTKGRTLTIRTYQGGNDSYYLRVFEDQNTPQVPDRPNFGDAGRANVKLERDENNNVNCVRLHDIETSPSYRCAGIGSWLLAQSEHIAKTHSAEEIYGLAPDDEKTHEWYARRGYGFRRGRSEGQEVYKSLSPDDTDVSSDHQEPPPGIALSAQGISALQGRESPSRPAEKHSSKKDESHASFKCAAAAGLAGTVILASVLSVVDRQDFWEGVPRSDSPDKQETTIEQGDIMRGPREPPVIENSDPPAQYEWSPSPEESEDISQANRPTMDVDIANVPNVPKKSQHDLVYEGQPTQYGCVPTSISMITDYWHQKNPEFRTSTPQGFLDINATQGEFRSRGMSTSAIHDELFQMGYVATDHTNATFEDLHKSVEDGPVLAVVKLGLKESGPNHAVVVTGITDDGLVKINDPWTGQEHIYRKDVFGRSWGSNFGEDVPTRNYLTVRPAPR